ncbi:hypothetical protein [Rhodococcus sp. IEGM 1379]|uniref:hypothetical protein n=1 Tax=Rhodococcus sp. IEGM 1379 TaxID=3047086 RepID=UPI0024B762B6|nr:hypothetical protein [Rhodococcus sp. IEGM 1379]MDI9915413.1 hypothetical protein [Rhodococcus sp. IEGM 1379]
MRRQDSSFLDGFGSTFPQHDVQIVRNGGTAQEIRTPARGMIQPKSGFFNLDTPIYEGDVVELDDPRGGRRQLLVREVNINDNRSNPSFSGMSHTEAVWGRERQVPPVPASNNTTYNGPVIQVSGGHAQLAWDNTGPVKQTLSSGTVTEGYEDLARAVTKALEVVNTADGVNEDDREIADESGREILAEVVNEEPDRSKIKRALAAIRGVLSPLAMTAATAGVETGVGQLVEQLVLG